VRGERTALHFTFVLGVLPQMINLDVQADSLPRAESLCAGLVIVGLMEITRESSKFVASFEKLLSFPLE
jgi:hypothetical protein